MSDLASLRRDLQQMADPEGARNRARFFKTGFGDYGEGDQFLGLTVPEQRMLARRYADLSLHDIDALLASEFHEQRFIGLALLVKQYQRGTAEQQSAVLDFYLKRLPCANNWDLVDTSAPYILGDYLKGSDGAMLDQLATSEDLWTRRVAIVATLAMIKAGNVQPALRISVLLLSDRHDLIHKAVGWALREVGKSDRHQLIRFLREHYAKLPRTTLRYAIEHLPLEQRKAALRGDFSLR